MKEKLRQLILVVLITLPMAAWAEEDSTMPDKSLRGEWAELNNDKFSNWTIKSFLGWFANKDGGSQLFFFESGTGERFYVMAANPRYWTVTDRKEDRQVFFVIHKDRFYCIDPKSDEERNIVEKLKKATTLLSGEGNKDPKLLDSLIGRLKSRAPMFKPDG